MNSFKCLSNMIIEKYNYKATKHNVDEFMAPLYEKIMEFRSIAPPSISSNLKDIVVQETYRNSNPTEGYVIKKLTTKEEVKEYYSVIQSIIDLLNDAEKLCFKAEYLSQLTIENLVEKTNLSESTIKRIRKSCIIKFALALDLAVTKGKKII